MISRKSPPIGADPPTRIASPGLQVSKVSNASKMDRPQTLPHIDVLRDRGRHIGAQAVCADSPFSSPPRAPMLLRIWFQGFREPYAWRGIEHKRAGAAASRSFSQFNQN
jgi:hypothetical protein